MSATDFKYPGIAPWAQSRDSAAPQRAYMTGMVIGLGGIMLFFAALLSAWVVRKGFAGAPELPLDLPKRLLAANTFVLLISSVAIEIARRQVHVANRGGKWSWWYGATVLGMLFLGGQLMAWRLLAANGVFLASSPDASFFYLLTAAHGIHLIGGICGLLAVAFWPMRRVTILTAAKVAAVYWHALTVIWICIFAFLLMSVS